MNNIIPQNGRKVNYTVFAWAMGVMLLVTGWMILRMETLDDRLVLSWESNQEVQIQLSQIQTDLQWIKTKLVELEKNEISIIK